MPCCLAKRIERFTVGPHHHWIRVVCRRHDKYDRSDEYYFYVEYGTNHGKMISLCGPYWTAFCAAYNILLGDVLSFKYHAEDRCFEVKVRNAADSDDKPWVQDNHGI